MFFVWVTLSSSLRVLRGEGNNKSRRINIYITYMDEQDLTHRGPHCDSLQLYCMDMNHGSHNGKFVP